MLGTVLGSGACTIASLPESEQPLRYRPELPLPESLHAAPFERHLSGGRRTTSFTQLAEGRMHGEAADRDVSAATRAAPVSPAVEPAAPRRDFFAFPRGAEAGTCLHAMLERVDFAADAAGLEPKNTYVVSARITHGDQLLFISDKATPVITRGNPLEADLVLKKVPTPPDDNLKGKISEMEEADRDMVVADRKSVV